MPRNSQNNWFALYVKSRTEKKVTERLLSKGFRAYCPTREVRSQWSDRIVKVQKPLFSSYVFVQLTISQMSEVLLTPGVVNFVKWLGKPAIIRELEIEAIQAFLEECPDVELANYDAFDKGDPVRVSFGPLQGAFGQVVRVKRHKLVLQIEQLGVALTAELPKSHLVPVL